MKFVKAKKHLGQHFLNDDQIAKDIVGGLSSNALEGSVLEIGPGMGVLTKHLLKKTNNLSVVEIDTESISYLSHNFPELENRIIEGDFLKMNLKQGFGDQFSIIGNFPYNISSQIFFKILDYKDHVTEVVGMLQKEVAERIVSSPGNKTYGILSVLLQVYFDVEYLFTVEPEVFIPPPKVRSGVIRIKRNDVNVLKCDEKLFKQIVKQGFQNRRKTLRNALKPLNLTDEVKSLEILNKRAEQLSVSDFEYLTLQIQH
ncbi:MAG: 16S rRNA (adenine(1518)-N(6)/adenine(1519)-N(6))-dimethyltransferase RsmA [Cyclobacteriaceae bacterium]|nr:16S rRNA (adenine(1518)-N(6)/adenine(1519)-N(6))-dimethyltransferase RsmA [Cyclobacteriaceae bacterium]